MSFGQWYLFSHIGFQVPLFIPYHLAFSFYALYHYFFFAVIRQLNGNFLAVPFQKLRELSDGGVLTPVCIVILLLQLPLYLSQLPLQTFDLGFVGLGIDPLLQLFFLLF